MKNWVKCKEALPALGDYSVLAYFEHGGIDMVHVEDYFRDITSGRDEHGIQLYTKWYIPQQVTHWMNLPDAPSDI